jgi:hypothetical protein
MFIKVFVYCKGSSRNYSLGKPINSCDVIQTGKVIVVKKKYSFEAVNGEKGSIERASIPSNNGEIVVLFHLHMLLSLKSS